MDLNIEIFIKAFNKTLTDMGNITMPEGKIEEFISTEFYSDFTCSIGIISENERFSLILSLEDKVIEKIVFAITQKINPPKSFVYDSIGEVLNIIVGIAQKDTKSKFNFSLPVSIIGKNHLVHLIHNEKSKRYLVNFEDGEIGLYLSFAQILNA